MALSIASLLMLVIVVPQIPQQLWLPHWKWGQCIYPQGSTGTRREVENGEKRMRPQRAASRLVLMWRWYLKVEFEHQSYTAIRAVVIVIIIIIHTCHTLYLASIQILRSLLKATINSVSSLVSLLSALFEVLRV